MIELANLGICFLAGTLGSGGAERQLYFILRALKKCGAKVRLLALTRGEFWEGPISDLGVPITYVGRRTGRISRLATIVSELRGDVPHVIQSQHFYTNLYAVGAARALGIREIGAIRNDGQSEQQANGAILGRLSFRAPRLLAANSRCAVAWAIHAGRSRDRIQLLPNVVDAGDYSRSIDRTDGPFRIVCVGRLHRQKRIDVFLNAVAQARAVSRRRVEAVVAGEGPERCVLQRLAHDLGLLPDAVRFVGHLSAPYTLYQEADLLMLTSDWEGTPNVVLEAMSCGLPVVATRAGGVPEIIQDGVTGHLADPGDVAQLARRAIELIDDADICATMGRRAREFVLANHAPSILPGRLREIYEAALA